MILAMPTDDPWQLDARGPYPRRAGNLVTPWIDGVPFYTRLAAAFRAARIRVWAIVSFIEPDFHFPDGTPWWELLAETEARGVEVRVLFWRNPAFFSTSHVFLGGPEDRARLREWGARWKARWDSSGEQRAHCHHQKAYIVDALGEDPIAFVGGMVLSRSTLAEPGHRRGSAKHDAFLELRGPAVADAEHNFVQRWNGACLDPAAPPWPDAAAAGSLSMPVRVPPPRGPLDVQLCRTLAPGRYPGLTQAPEAEPFDSGAGEATILDHYRGAFAAARRTIYLENQHPGQLDLLRALAAALARGVEVVLVVPGDPMAAIYRAAREVAALDGPAAAAHRYGPTFAALASLAAWSNFTLIALARSDPKPEGGWRHREIYTHAKLAIVDGCWLTLGSANFVDLSLDADHSELNASVWGEALAGSLLRSLIAEHGDGEVEGESGVELLRGLAARARASRASLRGGGPVLGACYALDPVRYGLDGPLTASSP